MVRLLTSGRALAFGRGALSVLAVLGATFILKDIWDSTSPEQAAKDETSADIEPVRASRSPASDADREGVDGVGRTD